jgi:hypothetical protein
MKEKWKDNTSDKHACDVSDRSSKASFKAAATPVHTIPENIIQFHTFYIM